MSMLLFILTLSVQITQTNAGVLKFSEKIKGTLYSSEINHPDGKIYYGVEKINDINRVNNWKNLKKEEVNRAQKMALELCNDNKSASALFLKGLGLKGFDIGKTGFSFSDHDTGDSHFPPATSVEEITKRLEDFGFSKEKTLKCVSSYKALLNKKKEKVKNEDFYVCYFSESPIMKLYSYTPNNSPIIMSLRSRLKNTNEDQKEVYSNRGISKKPDYIIDRVYRKTSLLFHSCIADFMAQYRKKGFMSVSAADSMYTLLNSNKELFPNSYISDIPENKKELYFSKEENTGDKACLVSVKDLQGYLSNYISLQSKKSEIQ